MGTRGSSEAVREGLEGAGTAGSIGVGSGEGAAWSSGAASSWGGWGSTDSPFCWARIHSETWKGGFSGGGAGLFGAETARRCGIRPSMAVIMARAFTREEGDARVLSGAPVGYWPVAGQASVAGLVEAAKFLGPLLDKRLLDES